MEIDTVLAVGALVVTLNAPFYALTLATWRTLARLQAACPLCRHCRQQDQAGDPGGGDMNG